MSARKMVRIPLAGNSYLISDRTAESGSVGKTCISGWKNAGDVFGIYVKFRNKVTFDASLKVRSQDYMSSVSLKCVQTGEEGAAEILPGIKEAMFGTFTADKGYAGFEMTGRTADAGKLIACPTELILYGIEESDIESYVSPKDKDNYYWTRRGPSVHCSYPIEKYGDTEWFYNEVTVPEGYDHIGVYAMCVGFRNGYCGIQVNSEKERRILFSIWSPFVTDNPEEIPEDEKVLCLGRNENTHVGEFGGEGSGGQSYMKYSWKAGEKYRILIHIKPTENDRTEFTAYFYFPEKQRFEMIASFSRPHTQCWVEAPHSFLENFDDKGGFSTRMAKYSNRWGCTKDGKWYTPDKIRFTCDNTGRSGWRMDYTGGTDEDGSTFILKHCGFINDNLPTGTMFDVDTSVPSLPDDVAEFVRNH